MMYLSLVCAVSCPCASCLDAGCTLADSESSTDKAAAPGDVCSGCDFSVTVKIERLTPCDRACCKELGLLQFAKPCSESSALQAVLWCNADIIAWLSVLLQGGVSIQPDFTFGSPETLLGYLTCRGPEQASSDWLCYATQHAPRRLVSFGVSAWSPEYVEQLGYWLSLCGFQLRAESCRPLQRQPRSPCCRCCEACDVLRL